MNVIRQIVVLVTLAALGSSLAVASAGGEDGVALAIVYDTSGSMKDPVRDETGRPAAKYLIANRALATVTRRIQHFATNAAAGSPRKIHAGLFVFEGTGARAAIPFGPFDAPALLAWAQSFSSPNGGTPLGNAVTTAGRAVLNSGLIRKHVLVITDGESNVGPSPAAVLPGLKAQAEKKQTGLAVHFVAFDVDAKVFDGVKKLGATVVGAANETQLNEQLSFILEKKILLEDEEPPKKK